MEVSCRRPKGNLCVEGGPVETCCRAALKMQYLDTLGWLKDQRQTVRLRNWLFARHTKIREVNCITSRETIKWAMFMDNGKIWGFERKLEFWKPCVCPINITRFSLKTLAKYWWWYMNVILCYNIIKFNNI